MCFSRMDSYVQGDIITIKLRWTRPYLDPSFPIFIELINANPFSHSLPLSIFCVGRQRS